MSDTYADTYGETDAEAAPAGIATTNLFGGQAQPAQAPAPAGAIFGASTVEPPAAPMGVNTRARGPLPPAYPSVDMSAPSFGVTQPKVEQSSLADFGSQLKIGAMRMGEGLMGATSFATNKLLGDPDAVQWIEQQKEGLSHAIENEMAGMSTQGQLAARARLLGGKDETGAEAPSPGEVGWLRWAGLTVADMLPSAAVALLPGGVLTQMAKALLFGAVGAGDAYNAMIKATDNATPEEMAGSLPYREARARGLSDIDAKKEVLAAAAPYIVATRGLVDTVTGASYAHILGGGAGAGRAIGQRMGIGAAEGIATMGGQAGADTAIDQQGRVSLGLQDQIHWSDVAREAASGAIGGALLGGGAGAIQGRRAPAPAEPNYKLDFARQAIAAPEGVAPEHGFALAGQLDGPPVPQRLGQDQQRQLPWDENFAGNRAAPPDVIAMPPPEQAIATPPPQEPPPVAPPAQYGPPELNGPPQAQYGPPPLNGPPQAQYGPPELNGPPLPPSTGEPPVGLSAAPVGPETGAVVPQGGSVVPGASAVGPETGAVGPTRPTTVNGLRQALTEAGFPPKGNMRKPALEAAYDEHIGKRAAAPEDGTSSVPEAAPVEQAGNVPPDPAAESPPVAPNSTPESGKSLAESQPAAQVATPTVETAPATTAPKLNKGAELRAAQASRLAEKAKVAERRAAPRKVEKRELPVEPDETPIPEMTAEQQRELREHNARYETTEAQKVASATAAAAKADTSVTAGAKAEQRAQRAQAQAADAPRKAWVKAVQAEREKLREHREGVFAEMREKGASEEDIIRAGAEINSDTRASRPELAVTDRELVRISRALTSYKNVTPAQVTRAHADSRPARERAFTEEVGTGHKTTTYEGEVDTQGGKLSADEAAKIADTAVSDTSRHADRQEARHAQAERDATQGKTAKEKTADDAPIMDASRSTVEDGPSTKTTQDYGEGGEKTRSDTSTDKTRIASDLLHKVLNGEMDVDDAAKTYGGQNTGKGRKRLLGDFAEVVKDQIKRATDPEAEARLKAMFNELATDKTLTGRERKVKGEAINRLMEQTDPDRISRLQAIHEELLGGGMDANEMRSRGNWGHRGARSIVDNHLEIASMTGQPARLGQILTGIVNDATIRKEAPGLHALAKRLQSAVDPDLEVHTPHTASLHLKGAERRLFDRYDREGGVYGYQTGEAQGATNPHIVIFPEAHRGDASTVKSLLHEALHSTLSDFIAAERAAGGSAPRVLDALRNAAQEYLDRAARDPRLTRELRAELQAALKSGEEFHTSLLSSPELQTLFAHMPVSPKLEADLRAAGYTGAKPSNLWDAFKSFVRSVVAKVAGRISPVERTLLDQMLDPSKHVVDRAQDFNASMDALRDAPSQRKSVSEAERTIRANESRIPRAEDLGFDAKTFHRAYAGVMSGLGRDSLNKFAHSGFADGLRKTALQHVSLDNIVKWNKERLGEGLEAFRSATHAIDNAKRQFHKKYADRVADLADDFNKLADRDDLAALMNDATMAQAHLGDGAENTHLRSATQQRALRELQKRYEALSPEAKKSYDAMRDYYRETFDLKRKAELKGLVDRVAPDITRQQRAELIAELSTQQGASRVRREDFSRLPSWDEDTLKEQGKIASAVANLYGRGFVRGDYFPLRRFGDYVVRYGGEAKDEGYGVEMFDSRAAAEARRRELIAQDVPNVHQVADKRTKELRDILPDSQIVNELTDAMKARGMVDVADEVRSLAQTILLQHQAEGAAKWANLRRRNIAGASKDAARIMAKEFVDLGGQIGHLEHGAERMKALRAMDLRAEHLEEHGQKSEGISARAVIKELEQRLVTDDNIDGPMANFSRKATALGYMQSLVSPSYAIINAAEGHLAGSNLIGARHGWAQSAAAMTRNVATLAPQALRRGKEMTAKAFMGDLRATDWNLAEFNARQFVKAGADPAHMKALFGRMIETGIIDHTEIAEMRRMANPAGMAGGLGGKAWERFQGLTGAATHTMDTAIKSSIAKTAFDMEMKKSKGDVAASVEYALETLRTATPNNSLQNKPRAMTSKGWLGHAGAPLLQFKGFGMHTYGVMANLIKSSLHGADAETRGEARKALAGMMMTHAIMAGGMTWLADPLRYFGGLYDFMTGASKPHNYQADVRNMMADFMGPTLAELVARGPAHALGIDLSQRTGIGNVLGIPTLDSFDTQGMMKMLGSAMTGASGQDVIEMAGGLMKMRQGDMWGVLDLAPRILRDVGKAVKLGEKGVTDPKGDTILPPDQITLGDQIKQGLGFQPSRVSEFREGREAIRRSREEADTRRSRLVAEWARADTADRQTVMEKVREHNEQYPGARITTSALLQKKADLRKGTQHPDQFGLTLSNRERRVYVPEGRFAAQ